MSGIFHPLTVIFGYSHGQSHEPPPLQQPVDELVVVCEPSNGLVVVVVVTTLPVQTVNPKKLILVEQFLSTVVVEGSPL